MYRYDFFDDHWQRQLWLLIKLVLVLFIGVSQSSCIPLRVEYFRPSLLVDAYKSHVHRDSLEVTGIEGVRVVVMFSEGRDLLSDNPVGLSVGLEPSGRHIVELTDDIVQLSADSTSLRDIRITELRRHVFRSRDGGHSAGPLIIGPLDKMLGPELETIRDGIPAEHAEYSFRMALPQPVPDSFMVTLPPLRVDGLISKSLVVRFDRKRRVEMTALMM